MPTANMTPHQLVLRATAALAFLATRSAAASSAPPLHHAALSGRAAASSPRSLSAASSSPFFGVRRTRRRHQLLSPTDRRWHRDDLPSSELFHAEEMLGDERFQAECGDDFVDATTAVRRRAHGPVDRAVRMCSVAENLVRGALLRIASDISGGTPLENVKCRVTVSKGGPMDAFRSIVEEGGIGHLWSGTPSRTVEGALMGAMFLVGATFTKKQVIKLTGSQTLGALSGGVVGGVLQAIVMTPAGVVFTSLNVNKGKEGYEDDNAYTVTRRIVREKGMRGMFVGGGPMAARQASNWASRSLFTEIARTNLGLTEYGVLGEIASGAIGGVGSCWNTPIETIRVFMHRDVARGLKPKKYGEYWDEIVEEGGYQGLFRGVTPRAIQAIWQTVFMVVVPNMLGL